MSPAGSAPANAAKIVRAVIPIKGRQIKKTVISLRGFFFGEELLEGISLIPDNEFIFTLISFASFRTSYWRLSVGFNLL